MNRSAVGSVIKAKDGSGWFARLRYTDAAGRSREKKRKFETKRRAGNAIADLQAEADGERIGRKTYRDLDRYYRRNFVHRAKFAGDHKVSGFRQDIKTVERYLDRALNVFADVCLEDITFADLTEYRRRIAAMPARGGSRSLSDINHHLKRLRRVLAVGVEIGWLSESPFKRGTIVNETFEFERTRVLTPAEELRLIAACSRWRKHLIPIIVVAIETGLRRGEMRTLKWKSVDLAKRIVKVEARNSKTLKSRLVPLSARAVETLAKLWQNSTRRQTAAVFGSSDFKKAFEGAAKDAKLSDLHFHDLRHTAITRMLEAGISPPLVMKISGHSQMKTFMRYVNQTETSIYDIALKLDRAA